MNKELLFKNEEEYDSCEKVLAAFKVKSINSEIDKYVAQIIDYAIRIDDLLEENNYEKRYLNRISSFDNLMNITFDDDLKDIDFKAKEIIQNYISRINTRFDIIKNSNEILSNIKNIYDIDNIDLVEAVKKARLTAADLIN